MAWDYNREESSGFSTNVPEGKHRIRIKSAEKAVSKSGNDMLVLQFEVSGYNATLYHYITFMNDKPEITNRMLTQFFDAFEGIDDGDFVMEHWIGKVGACTVKHEEYNGNVNAKLHYFIKADKQADLPPWQEPSNSNGSMSDADGFLNVPDGVIEELPF